MIERVAQAMETRRRELIAQPLNRIWPELARAAIEAMREPTDAMIDAGYGTFEEAYDPAHCYTNMINTALLEQTS